ncbi:MAG: PadR family transcriptional regulator [Acidobacteria bacterium]|nr:PadR family transcriptional regulator [Acidobacteriota bacterium]MDA1233499.1 PadR family transcriptional regulator [Acidobacteriota bacterium]
MARRDKLQGSLDLLILRTLRGEPQHGYGITSQIQAWSDGELEVEEGSLYPALHRLERDELLTAEWRETEAGRRAKYYKLTRKGRKHLEAELKRWGRLSSAIALFLERSDA